MIIGENVALYECTKTLWHEFYKKYMSDSMMEYTTYKYNYANVEKDFFIKTKDSSRVYFFVVVKKQVVGQIYLKRMDKEKKTTEMGIALINDDVKGRGYGTDALKLLIDYTFNTLCFDKILADTVLRNTRSQHLLDKLGFVFRYADSGFKYYELIRKNKS